MTDLTQMIRWQAGLVRGLAQSVLERAKNIRGSLEKTESVAVQSASKAKTGAKKSALKKPASKKPVVRKTKKKHA